MRKDSVWRAESADRHGRRRGDDTGIVERAWLDRHRKARRPLLQQHLGGLHPEIRMEAPDHDVATQCIGQRHQSHPLVVREIRGHDHTSRRQCVRPDLVIGSTGAAACEVYGVEEAVVALAADGRDRAEVRRALLGIDHGGQRRGVRRHHQFVAQATL